MRPVDQFQGGYHAPVFGDLHCFTVSACEAGQKLRMRSQCIAEIQVFHHVNHVILLRIVARGFNDAELQSSVRCGGCDCFQVFHALPRAPENHDVHRLELILSTHMGCRLRRWKRCPNHCDCRVPAPLRIKCCC